MLRLRATGNSVKVRADTEPGCGGEVRRNEEQDEKQKKHNRMVDF